MIKDFLILNCIGVNDKIGLKSGDKFYVHDFNQKVNKNEQLVSSILNLVKKYKNRIILITALAQDKETITLKQNPLVKNIIFKPIQLGDL